MSKSEILNTLSKNIKRYLNEYDMTQAELARRLEVSGQAITNWVNGTGEPRMNKIDKMCEIFHCKRSDLLEEKVEAPALPPYDNIVPITTHKIPVLGTIACGTPIYAEEQFEYYVEVGVEIQADYAVHAKGDSMIGARIYDGDLVFIRVQSTVDNGQIAAVCIDNEATLKRVYYYPDKKKLVLSAENPAYEPLVYVGEELNQVRILGKAVAFQSDVK